MLLDTSYRLKWQDLPSPPAGGLCKGIWLAAVGYRMLTRWTFDLFVQAIHVRAERDMMEASLPLLYSSFLCLHHLFEISRKSNNCLHVRTNGNDVTLCLTQCHLLSLKNLAVLFT